jgi:hypothetical protein
MAQVWHISPNDERVLSSSELKQLVAAGKLQPADLIRKDGMEKWIPARSVKGLFPVANPVGSKVRPPPLSTKTATDRSKVKAPQPFTLDDHQLPEHTPALPAPQLLPPPPPLPLIPRKRDDERSRPRRDNDYDDRSSRRSRRDEDDYRTRWREPVKKEWQNKPWVWIVAGVLFLGSFF